MSDRHGAGVARSLVLLVRAGSGDTRQDEGRRRAVSESETTEHSKEEEGSTAHCSTLGNEAEYWWPDRIQGALKLPTHTLLLRIASWLIGVSDRSDVRAKTPHDH